MSPTPETSLIMGWREYVDLPEWHIRRVRAKLDTGARTSAIHVASFEHLSNGRVRFEVVIREHPERRTKLVEADIVRESVVKPSSGQAQVRPVVRTSLVIGPLQIQAEVGLVCRQGMLCRMLVGRRALEGSALVDPSRTYLATSRVARGQGQAHPKPKASP